MPLSNEDRRSAVISLHEAGKSPTEIFRLLQNNGYNRNFIKRTIQRFLETNSTEDRHRSGRPKSVSTTANIKRVRSRLRRNPKQSLRKMAQTTKINRESLRRIVKSKLNLRPFKLQNAQHLTEQAKKTRLQRSQALLRRFADGCHRNILFSDEKLFTIEQSFNSQNDRVWAAESSGISQDLRRVSRTQMPASVMVWAGITAEGRTPLVFVPSGMKIDAIAYRDLILEDTVMPWAKKHFGNRKWTFQQDSAPAHKAKITQAFCRKEFPDFITSAEWPPYSPDLNPLDFCVWSILESKACATPHASLESLKRALQTEWIKIPQETLRAAVDAFRKRLRDCVTAKGGHFE